MSRNPTYPELEFTVAVQMCKYMHLAGGTGRTVIMRPLVAKGNMHKMLNRTRLLRCVCVPALSQPPFGVMKGVKIKWC